MKPMTFNRSRFRLKRFLDALHKFSMQHHGNGDPLPVVVGETVHHDPVDQVEALSSDGEEEIEIPDDSLGRLRAGFSLYAPFSASNGGDEAVMPRRRRTKKYLESVENTTADECTSFGFVISIDGDKVEIEAMGMSDVSGECELEPMAEPNLLSDEMRRWVRSFLIRKWGEKR